MKNIANTSITIHEKLVELLGVKESPAVSIIVNKDVVSPRNEKFRLAVKNAITEAVNKLKDEGVDKRVVADIEKRLEKIESEIIYENSFQSVNIFVSPQREEVLLLPFEVKNKVVVDDSFEIRELLKTVNRVFRYDVIVLGKKKTGFYNGYHNSLQADYQAKLPEGVEYYLENKIGMKDDPAKAETEALKMYVNEVDHFIRVNTEMHTPLIVVGDEKLVSYFKNKTKRPDKILAEIHGSYDPSAVTVIKDKINEKLDEYIKLRDEKLLERIQPDIDRLGYVSGIQESWTVAAMKEARIMLVEQDYDVEGYSVKDGLFLIFSKPEGEEYEYHADAVDDMAEMVLLQGGEVYFVSPGLLKQYDKIIVTTKY
ncbi:MAG: hypothetical protein GXO47_11865 [Chlorobi bacterium]|nr:hypothetical protein [Chlorobiota bacterium]